MQPGCLMRRAVKTKGKIEVKHFLIHAAKILFYFEFRIFDFDFL